MEREIDPHSDLCLTERGKPTKDKYYAAKRRWKAANPDRHKNAVLKSVHGITLDEFNRRLVEQDNRCAICRKDFSKTRRPYVDHVHDATKRVRELLCQKCNTLLGFAFDSTEILYGAIEYLNKHQ